MCMEGRVCTLECVYGREGEYTRLCVWKGGCVVYPRGCVHYIVCMEGRVSTLECVYGRKGVYTRLCIWKEGCVH